MDKHTTVTMISMMDERQLQHFVTILATNLNDVDTAMVFMDWLADYHPDGNISRQVWEILQSLDEKDPDSRQTAVFRIVGLFLEPCERCMRIPQEQKLFEDGDWKSGLRTDRWIHRGIPCLIHCGGVIGYCGYLGFPLGHPFYESGDIGGISELLDVHGGITFTGEDSYKGNQHCAYAPQYCNLPYWWIGWDYMHSDDWVPRMKTLPERSYPYIFSSAVHRWTFAEVKNEVNQAAEQLAQRKVSA